MARTVEIACTFIYETERAVQITDHTTGEIHWIPLSHVVKMVRDSRGANTGTITMSSWIAEQKGIVA